MECPKCHAENREDSRFCSSCAAPLGPRARAGPEAASLTKTLETSTPVHVLKSGSLIAGKYKIIDEVGHGGMGIVYKAEDIKLKRTVALKFLPPHLMDSPELKERFLIEAQAAAALSHPNICVIHEVGEEDGRSFIAMEFVEGETLRDKVRKGPLKTAEALDIAGQVGAGLGAAHRKGIVHRDVKSANIMVTEQGQAKVMDFGLAKLRGGSSLTKSQTTLGTVSYMSPEQARGNDLDGRTDLWSLGVVLYEMLTGELPFKGDHDQTVIHAILHREPKPPSKLRQALPPGLDGIVLRALVKKPVGRYQTMEELKTDLEAVTEGLKPLRARPARKILGIRTTYLYASVVAVLALLFGLNVGGLRDRLLGKAGTAGPSIRLAVLPFENLSGDPEQEYFSDGMTGEMIAQLGRLHPESLGVIARTSVMRYKKTNTPIDQIGRELNVGYVLEGSVQREGSRVRIRAELIKVEGQSQLWADSLEREMSGVLALQNEVSRKVAAALALKLLPAEQAHLANARAVNPEAYEAFLKGTKYWLSLTESDLDTAEKYFNLALQKDPNYGAAHGGIAMVWACRQQMHIVPPSEASPKARAAAKTAVSLDDTSAEAHFALADILTWTDWNWGEAEKEWKRTLELKPNNAEALATYSHFLMIVGRQDEALTHIQKALDIDPFNIIVQSFYAIDLLCLRRYKDAIAQARKALALQPGHSVAQTALYGALFAEGRYEEALALDRADFTDDRESLEAFDKGFAEGGYFGSQKRWAEIVGKRHREGKAPAMYAAFGYLWAKEKDLALDWLEKAFEEHDPNLPYLSCFPVYDFLRSEPRFQALLRRMGIPVTDRK